MERYQLRYFLAIVDQGNFSRAAAHCNVSQPTLSTGIAKLERQLGATLFIRSNQRVELTEGGVKLLNHARRIEREFNLAQQALGDQVRRQALRIGLLHSIPGGIAADAVSAHAQDDHAGVEFVLGSERELASMLARGRLDVSLTLLRDANDRFAEQRLLTEGYGLAMPETHRLAGVESIMGEHLAGDVMIVRRHCEALSETSRYFTERGVRPHFALRSTNDERIMQMIAAGLGVTVMPDSYRHPGVARAKLVGFTAQRTVGFQFSAETTHLRHDPPPILASLAAKMREALEVRGDLNAWSSA